MKETAANSEVLTFQNKNKRVYTKAKKIKKQGRAGQEKRIKGK